MEPNRWGFVQCPSCDLPDCSHRDALSSAAAPLSLEQQFAEIAMEAHAMVAAGNRILASAGKLEAALRSQVDQQKAMSKLSASVDSFIADWMACQGGMK